MSDRFKGHTPFPWKAIESPTAKGCLIVIGGNGGAVASASNVALDPHHGWVVLNDADARLIAAAPELLAENERLKSVNTELVEALQRIILMTDADLGYVKSRNDHDIVDGFQEVADVSRAALGEAKGESNV